MIEAWLYDGRSAVKRAATVEPGEGGLRLLARSGAEVFVASGDLVHVESRPADEVYGHRELGGWRLGLPRPIPSELDPLLPRRQDYGRWIDRLGLGRALAIGAAASAVIVLLGAKLPDLLAPHVPRSVERKFGEALLGDINARTCAGAEGQAALQKLTAKLTPNHRELNVRVANLPMVNAVALPGGNIVIFKNLLTEAEGPDEVAGVLAHEIAHVENRDVTRAMIRQFGFSLLVTSLGGTTGANAETLLSADYSRTAESRADGDAIEALQRAGISPVPTARFFDRLARLERKLGGWDGAFNYISSHPQSGERRQRFLASANKQRRYQASLSPAEWNALQDICWAGPTGTAAPER